MKEQLQNTWQIHQSKNRLLLEALTEEDLGQSLNKKGGRTVAGQWGHLHQTRLNWLEHVGKAFYDPGLSIAKDTSLTKELLLTALNASHEKIALLIEDSWEKGCKLPAFKQGLIPFIGYLISHESHHRGNILLTLKQSGSRLPSKLMFDLWEWNKL